MFNIALLIEFDEPRVRDIVAEYLPDQTRPDFADDLESWEQPIFEAIEELDAPTIVKIVDEKNLCVVWSEIEDELSSLCESFSTCQGVIERAYVRALEPVGDDELFDGVLYKNVKGELIEYPMFEHGLKLPDEFSGASSFEGYWEALMQ